jgi:hypothetical protein
MNNFFPRCQFLSLQTPNPPAMRFIWIGIFLTLCCAAPAWAQKKGNKKNSQGTLYNPYTPEQQPTTLSPNTPQAPRQAPKAKSSKKSTGLLAKKELSPEQEYRLRMEKVAEQRRKQEKEMRKPQYSDPSYFGHKKKPKIRPVGKRKFCHECGIVH